MVAGGGEPAAGAVDARDLGVGDLAARRPRRAAAAPPRPCRNMPRIPGWHADRPPPSVLVGSAPPTRSLPSSTNAPPSPLPQNPSASSDSSDHRRERVVDLAAVDVVGRDAGPLERQLARTGRGRLGEVGPLAHRRVDTRLAGAEHPDRRLGQVAGPLLGREHDRAAAVGADAAVQLRERVGDHRGCSARPRS